MAATATATERPNKVKISDAGPSRKKISIEIPAETVAEQIGSSLDTLISEVELPGFRRGRAPRRLVEKRFGSNVRSEAKTQLVASAYTKAIEEHKIRVIGEPRSEELAKTEIVDGKPLAFEVEVEVLPTFDLPNLDGIPVKKPLLQVADEMVDRQVDRMQLNDGRLEPRDNPEKGDYLTGHAVMTDQDGTTHYDIQDAVIQLPTDDKSGKGMILGVMVDDFAEQVGVPKPGDKITVKTTGPENHENEALRGKKLTVAFEVARCDRIIRANVADVAHRFGMESEADLRKAVRDQLAQRVAIEQQSAMRDQIAQHLVDAVDIEMPERITADQASRNLERRRLDLMHRGVDAQTIEEHMAELRASSGEVAVKELKLFFILDKAAEALNIKVSEAEMNGRIAQMAAARGERPEALRQQIIQRNQAGSIFQQIREHKVFDAMLAKANIEELSVEDYNKFMSDFLAGQGKHTPKAGKPAAKHEPKSEHKPEHKSESKSEPKKKEAPKKEASKKDKDEDKPKTKPKAKGK